MQINIKSFTRAQKALNYLQKHGIRCIIERRTGRGGCGFVLKITDSRAQKAEVCALLGAVGINCGLS